MPTENEVKKENYGQVLMTWVFSEYVKYERTRLWYLGAIIAGMVLLIYALLTVNILFALIIFITAIIIYLHDIKDPLMINFTITEDGLIISKKFYRHQDFKSFYIIYEPPEVKNLYLEFKNPFRMRLAIPLEQQNPLKVRKFLLQYISEDLDKENEPSSETLGRIFKI